MIKYLFSRNSNVQYVSYGFSYLILTMPKLTVQASGHCVRQRGDANSGSYQISAGFLFFIEQKTKSLFLGRGPRLPIVVRYLILPSLYSRGSKSCQVQPLLFLSSKTVGSGGCRYVLSWNFYTVYRGQDPVGIGLLYRPATARLHKLAEFIPWNQFLGSIIV